MKDVVIVVEWRLSLHDMENLDMGNALEVMRGDGEADIIDIRVEEIEAVQETR